MSNRTTLVANESLAVSPSSHDNSTTQDHLRSIHPEEDKSSHGGLLIFASNRMGPDGGIPKFRRITSDSETKQSIVRVKNFTNQRPFEQSLLLALALTSIVLCFYNAPSCSGFADFEHSHDFGFVDVDYVSI